MTVCTLANLMAATSSLFEGLSITEASFPHKDRLNKQKNSSLVGSFM
jgi:hypothetical protein